MLVKMRKVRTKVISNRKKTVLHAEVKKQMAAKKKK